MSRSRPSHASLLRLAVLLAALLATIAATPGRALAEDTPPLVSNGVITPGSLPYLGGTVTISADAVDDVGVTTVYANVTNPDGSLQSVQLIQSGPQMYSGTLTVGPNFTDSPVSYEIEVQATDTNGATDTQLIGSVDVDAQPQFDEAPVASDPSVEPRDLPAAGGTVAISAAASDNRGISEVYANIVGPDGSSASVPLEPNESSRYGGTFNVPANAGATPQQYAIEVVALDDIGQPGTVDAGVVTVAAPVLAAGRLSITPRSLRFGQVRVGWSAWRWVVLRNAGAKRSAPVAGVVRALGAPFSLSGDEVRFRLWPGQTRAVPVSFRPWATGTYGGSLTVQRDDGAQAGLAVALQGKAVKPPRRWMHGRR
jgi:hypothetical protein